MVTIRGAGRTLFRQESVRKPAFPLWLKLAYTAFVALLVPVYVAVYSPASFLWFSDLALLATVPALSRENGLLASTMAVGALAFELVWNFDFFARLLTGTDPIGIAGYIWHRTRRWLMTALPCLRPDRTARLGSGPIRVGTEAAAPAAEDRRHVTSGP